MSKHYYNYCDTISSGENQYSGIDFEDTNVVDAKYVMSTNEYEQGNPLIEALPPPLSEEAIVPGAIRGYNRAKIKDMSDVERMREIAKLKNWRFPLPFQTGLNAQFHKSLIVGYSSRKIKAFGLDGQKKLYVNPSLGVTSDAFALLGCSGTGKSTAIEAMLSHYPQVIRHSFCDGSVFYQIVYVYVTCPANSNIRTLLDNIAKQIDIALGNTDYMYFNLIKKQKTIGDKASHLVDIIKAFGIGTIIIDEIQFINISANTESSYNALLTLANEGGVRINVVGTEEAYDKIFGSSLKMYRRSGIMVSSDNYCADINFFTTICRSLTAYQWFDDYIDFDNDMIVTMYELTAGVIALLVNLYSKIHDEYLRFPRGYRPEVTSAFIKMVSENAFVGLNKHIDAMANKRKMLELSKKELQIKEFLERPEDKEKIAEITTKENTLAASSRINNIVATVKTTVATTGLKVTADEICRWTEKMAADPQNSTLSEAEVAAAVYKQLAQRNSIKGKTRSRKTKKNSKEHIAICNFLDNDVQTVEDIEAV